MLELRFWKMAEWHLVELENRLSNLGWNIISRDIIPEFHVSATWTLKRNREIRIDFSGNDDLKTLPLNKAYACSIQEEKSIKSLYFYKRGEMWDKNLDEFIQQINQL